MLGFSPDAAMMADGALLECKNLVPSMLGMKPAPALVAVGADPLPGAALGSMMSVNLSGARSIYAGTSEKLYRLTGTAWADVSGGGAFTLGDERWSFAQFGDSVIAAAKSQELQIATGGNFSPVANAPKARILVSLKGFVMAFDTNDTAYGDSPDRWWCSAYLDASDWTPNVATLCTTGRLVESAGAIVAAERLVDDVVVYKRNSMYIGRFVGPAEVWNFAQADSGIGCVGQNAVCSSGAMHYFINADDICSFDGMQVRSIAGGLVREWYRKQRDPNDLGSGEAYWDKYARLAWFFFTNINGGRTGLVFSPDTGQWGRADYDVRALLRYASPSATYEGGSEVVTTFDAGPEIEYDSSFWLLSEETMAGFSQEGRIVSFSGLPKPSEFTTGDHGDENQHTWCDRLTLRLQGEPDTAKATGYVKDGAQKQSQAGSSAMRDDGAFDMRQRGRWHRFRVECTGNYELIDAKPRLKQAGYR